MYRIIFVRGSFKWIVILSISSNQKIENQLVSHFFIEMSGNFDDGWQEQNGDECSQNVNVASKFISRDKPLGILQPTKHSLQPDMLFGWRPKVGSCPLPLKFPNPQTKRIMTLVGESDVFGVVYANRHFVNSVQVNQRYDYYWKYRSRYGLAQQTTKQHPYTQPFSPSLLCKHQHSQYQFNAEFQSSNLDFSIRVASDQYDCFIRSDSNTKGHCNWYYFSVKNYHKIGQVKINICNIGKTKNLYNKGMRPYVRETSMVKQQVGSEQHNEEWSQQLSYNVEFVQRVCRYGSQTKRFQLQFKYNFHKPNMEVFFAYAIPYSYSKLQKFIKEISTHPQYDNILVVEKLGESLGGLNVPLLKITSNATKQNKIQMHKKAVILSARIHPGESHSSYVIEGIIRQLLKKDETIEKLRQTFIFYIVPMINVDGVIVGNYRTSYSGKDLNRQFKNLDPFVFPQITRLHQLVLEIRQSHFRGVQFYMDFHGHSSKKNLFSYGPEHNTKNIYYFKCRIFPKLIENFHPIFSFQKSNFKITEGKKTTARAHMLWKLKIPMVYTFEVSNGMYETKKSQDILLTEKILLQAGQAVLKGFYKYVRLQMGIPAKILSKKIDFILNNKQNVKRRMIKSSKGIRDSSLGASKRRHVSKNNDNYLSQKFLFDKRKITSSDKKQYPITYMDNQTHQIDEQQQLDEEAFESLQEFMGLVSEVKNTKFEVDVEGGSDSEGEGEDLEKEDLEKLYKNIKDTKLLKQLKAKKKPNHRFSRQEKTKPKKLAPIQDNSNPNFIFSEIKKFKNQQLEELIKQTRKLNTQMSYMTLPSNKAQTLNRYPSMGDKMSRVSNRLNNVNAINNFRDNSHGEKEKEKIVKIAIVQKRFDPDL